MFLLPPNLPNKPQHSFRFVLHESLLITFSFYLRVGRAAARLIIKYHVVESAGDSVDQHRRDQHHHQRRRLRHRLLQVSVSEQSDSLKVVESSGFILRFTSQREIFSCCCAAFI